MSRLIAFDALARSFCDFVLVIENLFQSRPPSRAITRSMAGYRTGKP